MSLCLIKHIERKLEKEYGKRVYQRSKSGLEVLISTILSQNTTDINSSKAYRNLRNKFKTWDSLRKAPPKSIENAIKSGGLAKTKSKYIKTALSSIYKNYKNYKLGNIKKNSLENNLDFLTSLDGVGEKTAACVLLFAYNEKIMPVDTHVHRLTKRLGFVNDNSDRSKSFKFWFGQDDIVDYYSYHLNLVRHGRQVCHASKPECEICVLTECCKYFKERVEL